MLTLNASEHAFDCPACLLPFIDFFPLPRVSFLLREIENRYIYRDGKRLPKAVLDIEFNSAGNGIPWVGKMGVHIFYRIVRHRLFCVAYFPGRRC